MPTSPPWPREDTGTPHAALGHRGSHLHPHHALSHVYQSGVKGRWKEATLLPRAAQHWHACSTRGRWRRCDEEDLSKLSFSVTASSHNASPPRPGQTTSPAPPPCSRRPVAPLPCRPAPRPPLPPSPRTSPAAQGSLAGGGPEHREAWVVNAVIRSSDNWVFKSLDYSHNCLMKNE